MTTWNNIAKIKAIIIVIFSLPNLLLPIQIQETDFAISAMIAFIFPIVATPYITRFNVSAFKGEIRKPHWNDNPLTLKTPLSLFHFLGYFFLIVGFSMVISTALKFESLNHLGVQSIAFGFGLLIGISVTMQWWGGIKG